MALSSERFCSMRKRLLASISMVVILAVCLLPFGKALTPEGLALLEFKKNLQDSRKVLLSWNASDDSPCKWRYVICDNFTRRVTTLNLPRAKLSGTISPQLGNLLQLRRLGLHLNNLTGPIPASLGNLTYLRALYLHNNSLTGNLPDTLGFMPNLQVLDVSNNQLEGTVPQSYLNFTKRRFFFSGNNLLCGSSLLGLPSCQQAGPTDPWSVWKILLVSVSAFLLLKIILGLFLLRRWLREDKKLEIDLGKGGKLVMFKGGTTVPSSKEMLRAVRKLEKKDIVGEGGYSVVYKMVLRDHNIFALKKLKQVLEAARSFENELETLGEIKHCNLVKLRGYCVAPSAKLLIYDFISNGTLDQLLHPRTEEEKKNPVDWATRVKVALGVARALAYIHHSCEPRIIHRDVSATNVLLDEDLEPHLSDFGLAKLMDDNDTHVTVTVVGTFGYVAPEYVKTGQATEKTDVYSYGVLLLEILSGRRPTDSSISEEHLNLAGMIRTLRETHQEFEIVDKRLKDTVPHRELAIAMEIACRCISIAPADRPRMDKVAQYLERLTEFDSTLSTFTLSTNTSMNTRSPEPTALSSYEEEFDLDIMDLPGFRHDGNKFVLDMGHSL